VAQWKLSGSVKKVFDKEVRGYVYTLEGGASTTTTRMQLPKSDKASCESIVYHVTCVMATTCSVPAPAMLRTATDGSRYGKINH
jgi:hypothetical protein